MKKSLNLGNFKAVRAVAFCCLNKYIHLIALCIFLQPSFAQNPVNIISAATHVGGYHIKCNGQSTGIINANPNFGTPPYTYLWNTGDTVAQLKNKAAGIYIVAISDSNQVVQTDTFELRQPQALVYQSTLSDFYGFNLEKNGGNKGFIQLQGNGGTPPYRYLWSNGDSLSNRTNLTAGNYPFTIIDANQCSAAGSATIAQPTPVQVNITNIQHSTCFKANNGSAQIQISGGLGNFSVAWDNGSFSLNPTDLKAGNNNVRIFEKGRTILDTIVQINEPNELNIELTTSQYANGYQVSCVDCYNGTISSTITGGTAPYTYTWDDDNSSTNPNLSGLNGGDYSLMLLDANNCKAKMATKLRMPNPQDWSRFGNANIDPSEFIGSTDTSAVVFKSNNQEALKIYSNQIGISKPLQFNSNALNLSTYSQQYINPCNFQLAAITTSGQITTLQHINNIIKDKIANNIAAGLPDTVICPDSTQFGQTWSLLGNDLGNYGFTPKLGTTSNHDLNIITNNQYRMIVKKGTGNIGIGMTNPNFKLDVNGGVNATNFYRNGILLGGSLWNESNTNPANICYTAGNVGIGTCEPITELHIKGTSTAITLENIDPNVNTLPNKLIIESANGSARLISDHSISFFIDSDNNEDEEANPNIEYFRISKNAGSYSGIEKDLFYINGAGTGYIRELYVQQPLSGSGYSFPDYVFDEKYNLMSLAEFSKFIKKEKHLPGIQTAKDFTKENKGLAVSDMLLKLLKTQEEQALYIVQLYEQNELLKKEIGLLKGH